MSEITKTAVAERLAPTPPLPVAEVTSYAVAAPDKRAEIDKTMAEIDIADSNSILFFGTAAQGDVTAVADEMLEGVRNKDTGPAGSALNDMLSTLRGFDIGELDPNKKPSFFARMPRSRRSTWRRACPAASCDRSSTTAGWRRSSVASTVRQ